MHTQNLSATVILSATKDLKQALAAMGQANREMTQPKQLQHVDQGQRINL